MRAQYIVLLAGLIAFTILGMTVRTASAAPALRSCIGAQVAITSPAPGSTMSGSFSITGSAFLPTKEMRYYNLEYAPAGTENWIPVVTRVRATVTDGVLANVDTSKLPEGDYAFRLRAVDATGNYCEAFASPVHLSPNPNAAGTPTPLETPTEPSLLPTIVPGNPTEPALLPTIMPGTPTVLIDLPANGPQQDPALKLSTKTGGPSLFSLTFDVGGVGAMAADSLGQLGGQFVFGAQLTAGLFVLLGVVAFLRNNF